MYYVLCELQNLKFPAFMKLKKKNQFYLPSDITLKEWAEKIMLYNTNIWCKQNKVVNLKLFYWEI